MTKLRQVCAVAALAATASGTALADASANIGIMSDYIFRGFYQSEATAFAGIDLESDSGFYIGTWGANVKNGLETDLYFGYSGGGENFTWYTGFTSYLYTDDFDSTYKEFNIGLSAGFLTLDVAIGDYSNPIGGLAADPADYNLSGNPGIAPYLVGGLIPEDRIADKQTYTYVGATFAPENSPVYYFIGHTDYKNIDVMLSGAGRLTGTGKSGYWYEIGKSFEVLDDLELSVAALYSNDVNTATQSSPRSVQIGPPGSETSEFAVTFTLTKTIGLGN